MEILRVLTGYRDLESLFSELDSEKTQSTISRTPHHPISFARHEVPKIYPPPELLTDTPRFPERYP